MNEQQKYQYDLRSLRRIGTREISVFYSEQAVRSAVSEHRLPAGLGQQTIDAMRTTGRPAAVAWDGKEAWSSAADVRIFPVEPMVPGTASADPMTADIRYRGDASSDEKSVFFCPSAVDCAEREGRISAGQARELRAVLARPGEEGAVLEWNGRAREEEGKEIRRVFMGTLRQLRSH